MGVSDLHGLPVYINDTFCITYERKQYRFAKQKSHRRAKKWAKNPKNYKIVEVHRALTVQGKVFVSTKTFEELRSISKDVGFAVVPGIETKKRRIYINLYQKY